MVAQAMDWWLAALYGSGDVFVARVVHVAKKWETLYLPGGRTAHMLEGARSLQRGKVCDGKARTSSVPRAPLVGFFLSFLDFATLLNTTPP